MSDLFSVTFVPGAFVARTARPTIRDAAAMLFNSTHLPQPGAALLDDDDRAGRSVIIGSLTPKFHADYWYANRETRCMHCTLQCSTLPEAKAAACRT